MAYTLPPLPYTYDALEPIISKQIMELHHKKHHQTYINNLNAALQAQSAATQAQDITALIAVQQKIKFNGGGHINHTLFWANLAPPGAEATRVEAAAPALKQALESRWGTVEGFWEKFGAALLGVQGSGWGWLVVDRPGEGGKLEIVTTKDQDPVADGTPVFGVDMWEHAYYLQYLNNKAGYVNGIAKVINWAVAEERYTKGLEAGSLKL